MIAGFNRDQVTYFMRHLPEIEARRAYPFAHLEATILNMMGGKGDVDEHGREVEPEKSKPPKPEHLLWTAQERMQAIWYARFSDMPAAQAAMSEATAQDIMDNLSDAPAWALHLVPIDEAKQVLGRT